MTQIESKHEFSVGGPILDGYTKQRGRVLCIDDGMLFIRLDDGTHAMRIPSKVSAAPPPPSPAAMKAAEIIKIRHIDIHKGIDQTCDIAAIIDRHFAEMRAVVEAAVALRYAPRSEHMSTRLGNEELAAWDRLMRAVADDACYLNAKETP